MSQSALDAVTSGGERELSLSDNHSRSWGSSSVREQHRDHQNTIRGFAAPLEDGAETLLPVYPILTAQHCEVFGARSNRDLCPPLAAAVRQDRTPSARTHTQPEAVLLVPTAVVRLVSTLRHVGSPRKDSSLLPGSRHFGSRKRRQYARTNYAREGGGSTDSPGL